MNIDLLMEEEFQAIVVSILCGAVVGIEREYRNKSAGFRTVILICFGATIFTLASRMGNLSDDRIAANIVTGIGFLGAGVIYQGKFSVQGLTTAAVIWTMAAIGMLIGFGEFILGFVFTVLMVLVLSVFQNVETLLSNLFLTRTIHITFIDNEVGRLEEINSLAREYHVNLVRRGLEKDENRLSVVYDISGKRKNVKNFNERMLSTEYVYTFSNL